MKIEGEPYLEDVETVTETVISRDVVFLADHLDEFGEFFWGDFEFRKNILFLEDHLGKLAQFFICIADTRETEITKVSTSLRKEVRKRIGMKMMILNSVIRGGAGIKSIKGTQSSPFSFLSFLKRSTSLAVNFCQFITFFFTFWIFV